MNPAFEDDGRISVVPKDADQAFTFLSNIKQSDQVVADVDLKRLRRRIDWHLMPLFFLCYTVSFLDKVILNVSRQWATDRSQLMIYSMAR